MPPRLRVNVVWFKCTDLRTHDHAALRAAHAGVLPVLHLYVFDPFWHANRTRICGFAKTGPVRTRFQLEALADLSDRLAAKGHVLNTRTGISTAACFEELCSDYTVNAVFAFHEVCSEELRVERQVREVLLRRSQGALQLFWGFELYHRDDLRFDPSSAKAPYHSYTAFRKRVEESSRVRPSDQQNPRFLSGHDASVRWPRGDLALPCLQKLMGTSYNAADDPGPEKDPRAELRWQGGETAALKRVKEYIWDEDSLGLDYVGATMTMDPAKSCMRDKAMSKLSPWLAHGCISPRLLYEEVQRYERERRKTKSTYWITHELMWRDFVRFGSMQAGTSIFKIGGPKNGRPAWRWSTDQKLFCAWKEGRTGFPFLDCFMRELKTTGYCNHMGRECSGWFLIGDLGIDWRMGAEWFESVLVDYEPTANWYNWTYRCLPAIGRGGAHGSVERPPGERLQGLEILKWGAQHDPDSHYIKRWIPELELLPATVAREPWRLGLLDSDSRSESGGLRPVPKGRIDVNKEALAAVLAMGFEESESAIALYRTWNDPDAALALLLSERDADAAQNEEEDLQQAIDLSLRESSAGLPNVGGGNEEEDDVELHRAMEMSITTLAQTVVGSGASRAVEEQRRRQGPYGGFRYGEDYPKPVIQPVSLMGTEETEETARREQAKRDQQIAAARQQLLMRSHERRSDGGFSKVQWEESRQMRPAETPTAASWRGSREQRSGRVVSMSGGGTSSATAGRDGGEDSRAGGCGSDQAVTAGSDRKRRWQEKRGAKEPEQAHRP